MSEGEGVNLPNRSGSAFVVFAWDLERRNVLGCVATVHAGGKKEMFPS